MSIFEKMIQAGVDPAFPLGGLVDAFTVKHLEAYIADGRLYGDEDREPFMWWLANRWAAMDPEDIEYDTNHGWPLLRNEWYREIGR